MSCEVAGNFQSQLGNPVAKISAAAALACTAIRVEDYANLLVGMAEEKLCDLMERDYPNAGAEDVPSLEAPYFDGLNRRLLGIEASLQRISILINRVSI